MWFLLFHCFSASTIILPPVFLCPFYIRTHFLLELPQWERSILICIVLVNFSLFHAQWLDNKLAGVTINLYIFCLWLDWLLFSSVVPNKSAVFPNRLIKDQFWFYLRQGVDIRYGKFREKSIVLSMPVHVSLMKQGPAINCPPAWIASANRIPR